MALAGVPRQPGRAEEGGGALLAGEALPLATRRPAALGSPGRRRLQQQLVPHGVPQPVLVPDVRRGEAGAAQVAAEGELPALGRPEGDGPRGAVRAQVLAEVGLPPEPLLAARARERLRAGGRGAAVRDGEVLTGRRGRRGLRGGAGPPLGAVLLARRGGGGALGAGAGPRLVPAAVRGQVSGAAEDLVALGAAVLDAHDAGAAVLGQRQRVGVALLAQLADELAQRRAAPRRLHARPPLGALLLDAQPQHGRGGHLVGEAQLPRGLRPLGGRLGPRRPLQRGDRRRRGRRQRRAGCRRQLLDRREGGGQREGLGGGGGAQAPLEERRPRPRRAARPPAAARPLRMTEPGAPGIRAARGPRRGGGRGAGGGGAPLLLALLLLLRPRPSGGAALEGGGRRWRRGGRRVPLPGARPVGAAGAPAALDEKAARHGEVGDGKSGARSALYPRARSRPAVILPPASAANEELGPALAAAGAGAAGAGQGSTLPGRARRGRCGPRGVPRGTAVLSLPKGTRYGARRHPGPGNPAGSLQERPLLPFAGRADSSVGFSSQKLEGLQARLSARAILPHFEGVSAGHCAGVEERRSLRSSAARNALSPRELLRYGIRPPRC